MLARRLEGLGVRAGALLAIILHIFVLSARRSRGYSPRGGRFGGRGCRTSRAVLERAFQSRRRIRFLISVGLISRSSETSSASFGWRGKDAEVVLQVLTAQVRKLRVRTFILSKVMVVWEVVGRV